MADPSVRNVMRNGDMGLLVPEDETPPPSENPAQYNGDNGGYRLCDASP